MVLTDINREQAQAPGVQDGMQSMRAIGAAFVTLLTPGEAHALLVRCGFAEVTHLTVADANARYFAGRSDGLHAAELELLIVGSTPGHSVRRQVQHDITHNAFTFQIAARPAPFKTAPALLLFECRG
jgi:hypothetical protein